MASDESVAIMAFMNRRGQADGLHLGLMFLCFLALGACGFMGYMLYKGKTSNVQHNDFNGNAKQQQSTIEYITVEKHYALLDLNPFHWGGAHVSQAKPSETESDVKEAKDESKNTEVTTNAISNSD